ncbi:MAG: FecR domain-containing protein [Pirellulales bacterium]
MDFNHVELLTLSSKFQDNCLEPEELARLNYLLRDEEARQEFIAFSNIHYSLKEGECADDCRRLAASIAAVHERIIPSATCSCAAPRLNQEVLAPSRSRRRTLTRLPRYAFWGTLAASAAVLVSIAALISSRMAWPQTDRAAEHAAAPNAGEAVANVTHPGGDPADRQPDYVARIIAATNGVNWLPDGAPRDILMRMSAGEVIKVNGGTLKIEFSGGAVIILNGPAELEFLTDKSARLVAGSLTGRSEAGNFTLQTPNAEVIDVGTEFGVAVDNQSDTKVAVFEGEVHVKSSLGKKSGRSLFRLTTGMSVRIDKKGMMESGPLREQLDFQRELPMSAPTNLGVGELSFVDVICGSAVGEFRIAGAIDPLTGHWGKRPWAQPKGVSLRPGKGQFVPVGWNPMVDGIFVPPAEGGECQADSQGRSILMAGCSGTSWGPVWARRRINDDLDPFIQQGDQDSEGFWGAGTTTAMLDRLRWARDGLVGMHANIGMTIDLDAVRQLRSAQITRLRGVVTLLERSHVSQPFHPKTAADFRVFVDGQERYQRMGFCREDGDSQFGATIDDADKFLTLVVSDSGDGNLFDRVILIDPVLELNVQ